MEREYCPLIYDYQSREEWLVARGGGIGASEAAAVMGESPWSSPWKVWAEKTEGRSLDEADGNEAAEWGLAFERPIAERFAIRSKRMVELPPPGIWRLYVHPLHSWMRATPDAFQWPRPDETELPDGEPGCLQVKCAGEYKREEWKDGPPLHYEIQLQWEMAVTGCRWGSLIVLIGGNRLLGPFDRLRSDGFLESIHPYMQQFWTGVLDRTPPKLDGSQATAKAISKLYREDEGSVATLDQEAQECWDRLAALRKQEKELKEQGNLLRAQLIDKLRSNSVGLLPGGGRLTYRTVQPCTYTVSRKSYRVLKGPNE